MSCGGGWMPGAQVVGPGKQSRKVAAALGSLGDNDKDDGHMVAQPIEGPQVRPRRRTRRLYGFPFDTARHPGKTRAGELAFRRGFHHGITFALIAVRAGATLADLVAWERQVSTWRDSDNMRVLEPPAPGKGFDT